MSKQSVLNAMATHLNAELGKTVYVYPWQNSLIPDDSVDIIIIEELRGVDNENQYIASGCIYQQWTIAAIYVVGRGEAPNASQKLADWDIIADEMDALLASALLTADIDTMVTAPEATTISRTSWYQWGKKDGSHDPFRGVEVRMPVLSEI